MQLTQDLIEKIRKVNSIEELETKIKEHNINVSKETISSLYNMYCVNNTELSEEELDNVTGGTCYSSGVNINSKDHPYVITTIENSCDAFNSHHNYSKSCKNCDCFLAIITRFSGYCSIRWKGHDRIIGPGNVQDNIYPWSE